MRSAFLPFLGPLLALSALMTAGACNAQALSAGPVRIIATGPAGSALDLVVRLLASGLSAPLGQNVVVENRPTANGALAAEAVAHSPADGHTLLFATTSALAVAPHLNKSIKWNPLKDFTALVEVGTTPSVIAVAADSPYTSFAQWAAAARQKPDQITFGVLNLTLSHFVALALKQEAGIDVRIVPFSGQPQMVTGLISHDVDSISTGAGSLVSFFDAGRMKPLAVTSGKRIEGIAAPAIAETLPGFNMDSWYGLLGPGGMDSQLVQQINRAANAVIADPKFKEKLRQMATAASGGAPERLKNALEADHQRFGALIRKSGLAVQQ